MGTTHLGTIVDKAVDVARAYAAQHNLGVEFHIAPDQNSIGIRYYAFTRVRRDEAVTVAYIEVSNDGKAFIPSFTLFDRSGRENSRHSVPTLEHFLAAVGIEAEIPNQVRTSSTSHENYIPKSVFTR